MSSDKSAMTFLDHLEDLRWTLIKSFIAIIIFSSAIYFFWKPIFEIILVYPISQLNPKPQLIFTNPSEAFIASIKIALFGGVFVSSPYILYLVWRFVAPGLFKNERKYLFIMVSISFLCFVTGMIFSFIAIPYTVRFLSEFRTESLSPFFSINSYLGFIIKLTLAFGLVFQLPAVSFVLTRMGIITYKTLFRVWRIAVVAIFVIAAIITPPDIVSQAMMAVPLFILYFISIGISFLSGKKNHKEVQP